MHVNKEYGVVGKYNFLIRVLTLSISDYGNHIERGSHIWYSGKVWAVFSNPTGGYCNEKTI